VSDMTIERLDKAYADYFRAGYGSDPIPGVQMQETRRAFFAGAAALFARVLAISVLPEEEGLPLMDVVTNELTEFREKVERGDA